MPGQAELMTERKPPRDPLMPPPIPQRPPQHVPQQGARPPLGAQPSMEPRLNTVRLNTVRLNTVRPGIDRPEDRPATLGQTAGRPANRQQARPMPPRPAYDPNQPPVGRTSRSEPEPRRTGWIWALGIGVSGLVVLAGAGAAYLAFAPPIGMICDQMIAQVRAKTGRDLIIGGPATLTVGPGLGLGLLVRDVTLSAAPGMGREPLVSMAELAATVRLWPLLMRRVSVDSVVIKQPVFDLRIDGAGKRSWDFAETGPEVLLQYAQAAPGKVTAVTTATDGLPDAVKDFVNNASDPDNPSPQMKAKLAKLEELTLGDVRIEGGTVLYSDARNGANHVASAIDAQVGLKSLASPLDASGKVDYQGQTIEFTVKLASPKAIIEDRPAKLAFSLSGPPIEAKYDGTVTARATVDLDGDVSVKAQSLRALAAWLGAELPPAEGFGPVAATGKLRVSGASYALNLASLGLDGATASGTVAVDATGSARPRVSANLRVSELDLNKYTLAAVKAIPAKPVAARPAGGPKMKDGTTAKSIEDLLNSGALDGAPKVKGYTKRAGWRTEPIALDGLGLLDLDAKLVVGGLVYRDIRVGQSAVGVALKGRVLRANFDDVQLYDGRGRGFITIDANAQPPVVGGNLSVDGVAAANILKDVADFELLAGTARMSVAIGAQGTSEAELVASANGKADFAFTNGAIVGYNIPGTVRGLMQGKFNGFDRVPNEKTDFNELAASFTIANGVATNQDLRLTGPTLKVTGAGQIQLPAQALDYTVKPKVTAALLGQSGGVADALGGGIDVPVRITGPWAKPQFAADSAAALKDPKTIEAAKEIGRKLKDNGTVKEIGSALKGLWSKGGEGAEKPNAKQMLEKLFKKKEPAAN